jgi:hypothetical protein
MIKSIQNFVEYYSAKRIYIPDESICLPRRRNEKEAIYLFPTRKVYLPKDYIAFCNEIRIEGCSINFVDLSPGSSESIVESIRLLNEDGKKNPVLSDNMTHFASFDSDILVFEHLDMCGDDYNVSYVDISSSKNTKIDILSNNFVQFILIISSIDFFIDQNVLSAEKILQKIFHPNSGIAPPASSRDKWADILSQIL